MSEQTERLENLYLMVGKNETRYELLALSKRLDDLNCRINKLVEQHAIEDEGNVQNFDLICKTIEMHGESLKVIKNQLEKLLGVKE